ncbi:glycosyltransferase family 4 protein [Pedobacter nutrimenti]|uniref:glycosyltransferase family 4 protein n=1 Tax=Pedobacter nutrimenti TaxID=1241337 RepID=UPI00293123DA|nr:glycosyltransferase family 4 protein [Pedobacter nutrimenti]
MNKVLIIQEVIPHYRLPLFNTIGKTPNIELTVAYDEKGDFDEIGATNFNTVPYSNKKIWKFYKIKQFRQLIKSFSHVIIIADLRWLPTFILLLLFRKKAKVYFWGIGMSSEDGLRKKTIIDKVRFLLNDISSGTILYSPKIAEYYVENVNKREQVYVAKNTVEVEKFPFSRENRTKILSIGSFKKYKNLGNLVIAFSQIIDKLPENITLDFIGDGEEEEKLKQLVKQYDLEKRVIFWGRRESDSEIFPIISLSMVSVSPTQAGLAVLHSMAFGCPFLTSNDSVTGGERFYIEDNVNGYFYDGTIVQLAEKLLWIVNNQKENMLIANNAYEFYHTNCNISNYANSFIDIIKSK